jgi:FkbM family methyltransferase
MGINIFATIESLRMQRPKGVFQIGASSGQEIPYFVNNGVQCGVFIEPLPGPFEMLSRYCGAFPGFLPIQAICSSVDGSEVSFYVASNNGESSSILEPEKHLVDYPHVTFKERITLTAITADSIFRMVERSNPEIANSVDLVYLDAQGAELNILQGASQLLHKAKFVYTEVGLGGGYKGDVRVCDLIFFLKSFDFDVYWLEIGVTGWGDALFVKRDRHFLSGSSPSG